MLAHRIAGRWLNGKVGDILQELGPEKSHFIFIPIGGTMVRSRKELL